MTIATVQQKPGAPIRVEPVYVFGCRVNDALNEGSAALAARFHGAIPDVWRGPNGNGYAIPCRSSEGTILPLKVIGEYLAEFLKYARNDSDRKFRIARFGCDKGGYKDSEMAALWRNTPPNCALPAVWQRELGVLEVVRILIFDPLMRLKNADWQKILQRYITVNLPLWGVTTCEFVSIAGPRDTLCTANAAQQLGFRHREIRADPQYYKEHANVASEMLAIWHSTHLLSVTDPDQTAVPNHVRILNYATRDGLFVDDLSMDDTSSC